MVSGKLELLSSMLFEKCTSYEADTKRRKTEEGSKVSISVHYSLKDCVCVCVCASPS